MNKNKCDDCSINAIDLSDDNRQRVLDICNGNPENEQDCCEAQMKLRNIGEKAVAEWFAETDMFKHIVEMK